MNDSYMDLYNIETLLASINLGFDHVWHDGTLSQPDTSSIAGG